MFKQVRGKTVYTNGKLYEYICKYLPKTRPDSAGRINEWKLQPAPRESIVV